MLARSNTTRSHRYMTLITAVVAAFMAVSLLPGMAAAAPSQTIQQMVDAARPGATVNVPAGVYNELVYVTKPLTLKAAPGTILDGGNRHAWFIVSAHDVTIDGFEMRGTTNWQYWGGITNSNNDVHYDRLTIQNNTLRGASYAAIATKLGNGHRILNNTIYGNGALAIRLDSGSGHLVSGNRLYDNNLANGYNSGWEAGGIKISGNYGGVHNVVVENNEAFNNNGAGIWVDVDGNNITIRNNNVHHNSRSGITYELSFGGTISGNRVWENGHGYGEWGWGAGILIQNSSNVSVAGNTVAWNADGISVVSQNRGETRWNQVKNVHVFENAVAIVHPGGWDTYAMAWLQDWSGNLLAASSDNRGWANQYWINESNSSDPHFRWGDDFFHGLADFMGTQAEAQARYLSGSEVEQRMQSASIELPNGQAGAGTRVDNNPSAPSTTSEQGELLAANTGNLMHSAFKSFWEQNGGLPIFGYALTDEFQQVNADSGKLRTVQYLERQRFEYHPELAGTPYEVLIGRLGVTSAERRGLLETESFQPLTTNPAGNGCLFFAETGHSLCGRFLTYWRSQGLEMGDAGVSMRESVALFGYPISEVFTDPETGLSSQYFERAIFEHHPANDGTAYEVLLVRLGADAIAHGDW